MASLKLHEKIVTGLEKIPSLTEENFQELVSVLESYPLKLYQQRIFDEDAASQVSTFPKSDAKAIVTALFGLYVGRVGVDVDTSTYVNDITESLKEVKGESAEWLAADESLGQFKERLTRLLSIKPLEVVAKANDVLIANGQTYLSAQILTDIRAVFGESVEASPAAAVIVHMLNIEYYQNGERQEFFVALDTADIGDLMKTLERAKTKAESLKRLLASTGVTYVEVSEAK